jgi:hypothetical protein
MLGPAFSMDRHGGVGPRRRSTREARGVRAILIQGVGATVAAAILLASFGAAPAAAADLDLEVPVWMGGYSIDEDPFVEETGCMSGLSGGVVPGAVYEHRCALEFDLSSAPDAATITSVSLRLRNGGPASCGAIQTCPITLAGYAGDGIGALDDLTAGSTILTFNVPNAVYNDYEVTAFVLSLLGSSEQWAGFVLSSEVFIGWLSGGNYPPVLRITYTVPPTAPPSAPPTSTEPGPPSDSSRPLVELIAMLLLVATGTRLVAVRVSSR